MPERRSVITGLGLVTPAGIGVEEFGAALMEGRPGVREISLFDASGFPCRVAGDLPDFSARKYVPKSYRKSVKVMARDIEIAVAAADLAFRDAGLATRGVEEGEPLESKRLGCNIGAGLICTDLDELGMAVSQAVTDGRFDLRVWGQQGIENLTPLWLLKYLPNMLACHVTIIHGCEGPSNNITCGSVSAHLSVMESIRWIERDEADAAIAGGAESKLNAMGLLRQGLLGRLVTDANDRPGEACRPFDAGATGTVIGEGGGLVILEEAGRAAGRGARVYAEVAGAGAACDPDGLRVTEPNVGSMDLAVRAAMDEAGVGPEDIDCIVCQGNGVPAEDRLEAEAWHAALGDAAGRIPAFAVTGSIGSLFAGTGGPALAAGALAIRHGAVPPTVNCTSAAEGVGLNLSDRARPGEIRCVLTGAFALGGQSGACVLRKV